VERVASDQITSQMILRSFKYASRNRKALHEVKYGLILPVEKLVENTKFPLADTLV